MLKSASLNDNKDTKNKSKHSNGTHPANHTKPVKNSSDDGKSKNEGPRLALVSSNPPTKNSTDSHQPPKNKTVSSRNESDPHNKTHAPQGKNNGTTPHSRKLETQNGAPQVFATDKKPPKIGGNVALKGPSS